VVDMVIALLKEAVAARSGKFAIRRFLYRCE
jgi:hypothetical protein